MSRRNLPATVNKGRNGRFGIAHRVTREIGPPWREYADRVGGLRISGNRHRTDRLVVPIRRGEVGELKIGFGTSVMAEELLPSLIKRFVLKYPDVRVEFFDGATMVELVAAAEAQEVDVIFIRPPIISLTPNLRVSPFSHSELHVALAADHPLAARATVSIKDIADEKLIMMVDAVGMGMSHRILSLFEEAGVFPNISVRTSNITTLVRLIGAGLGISMLPRSIPAAFNSIIGVPIDATGASSEAVMIHKRGPLALHVQNFVRMVAAYGKAGGESQQVILNLRQ